MLFCTSSAEHVAKGMRMEKGRLVLKRFSDGEIYCRVEEDVRGRDVWVLASTQPPADNLLELALLLDSLSRGGARIGLFILYFGYARQDRVVNEGEALSAKVVSDILGGFRTRRTLVLHMHSSRVAEYFRYENVLPTGLFSRVLRSMEVVVAPDKGALDLAREVSKEYGLQLAYMEKHRPAAERVEITRLVGEVRGRRAVIVDDMISTGGTVVKASKALEEAGAKEVNVVATHGIFSDDAVRALGESPIKMVYVTNSIRQTRGSEKIKTVDLSRFVEDLLSRA